MRLPLVGGMTSCHLSLFTGVPAAMAATHPPSMAPKSICRLLNSPRRVPRMHPSRPTFRSLVALTAISTISAFGESSDTDHYLQTLAETQNFSLGRPVEAMPTADGKSVFFLLSFCAVDGTRG